MVRTRARLTPAQAQYVPRSLLNKLGKHSCDVTFTSGLATDADGLTDADRDKISRQHPELLAPFCLAGAYVEYDSERQHVFTRRDVRTVMTTVCTEAVRRGYIRPTGGDDAAVKALARRTTIRMVHSGQIHLLP